MTGGHKARRTFIFFHTLFTLYYSLRVYVAFRRRIISGKGIIGIFIGGQDSMFRFLARRIGFSYSYTCF